jgi:hypothetical protein
MQKNSGSGAFFALISAITAESALSINKTWSPGERDQHHVIPTEPYTHHFPPHRYLNSSQAWGG